MTTLLLQRLHEMKQHKTNVSMFCLFVALIAVTCSAIGQESGKPMQFGRYDLINGQGRPMCQTIGEQLQKLQHVPLPKPLIHKDDKDIIGLDVRCNFPIFNGLDNFEPQKWKEANLLDEKNVTKENLKKFTENLDLAQRLIANQTQRRKYNHNVDAFSIEELKRIMDAQGPLAFPMIRAGLIRIQLGEIRISQSQKVTAYRISIPDYPKGDRFQRCWSVLFDPDSSYDILKFTAEPIVDMFYYKNEPYAFMHSDAIVGVIPLRTISSVTESNVSSNVISDNFTCQFESRLK
jgi:hypothetical protein